MNRRLVKKSLKKTLKEIVSTESEDGSWEIITNSFEKDKDLRLIHYTNYDTPIVLDLNHNELMDLIYFLNRVQGKL